MKTGNQMNKSRAVAENGVSRGSGHTEKNSKLCAANKKFSQVSELI